ncbi:hypothetical protein M9458_042916, partial [Cirrhinus mrigala]
DASTTPDPVPSPPSPCSVELQPKPNMDGEPKPSATDEPIMSDQLREPATTLTMKEVSVKHEDAEEGPAHCTSTE